jgi:drug/metabolite transporter (DMT)-like permease
MVRDEDGEPARAEQHSERAMDLLLEKARLVFGEQDWSTWDKEASSVPEQRSPWSVPAVLAIVSLCLCFPLGLILIWTSPVHRTDSSTWSIRWKVAYSLAYLLPLAGFVTYFRSQHMTGGTTFASVPICGSVMCVAIADILFHRSERG